VLVSSANARALKGLAALLRSSSLAHIPGLSTGLGKPYRPASWLRPGSLNPSMDVSLQATF
jgi:hypothetical protein